MTTFGADPAPESSVVNSVGSPLGGTVDFSAGMSHLVVGSSWGSWSHGYAGDVYWTGGATTVSLTMPANTAAFYFFAEPNPLQSFQIVAEAQDGTTITQTVSGAGGASNYGFYGTSGDLLTKVTVSSSQDFAVGEFGIAQAPSTGGGGEGGGSGSGSVPDNGNWSLALAAFGLGGAQLFWRRRTV